MYLLEARKSKGETRTEYNLNEKASVSKALLEGLPEGSLLRDRESWYPPVGKMVWVLEQLRDFVQVSYFFFIVGLRDGYSLNIVARDL